MVAPRPVLDLVSFVRSPRIVRPVVVLEEVGDVEAYPGPNFTFLPGLLKHSDFSHFVVANNVGMVIADSMLMGDLRVRDDPSWQQFLKDPRSFGLELSDGREGFPVFVRQDVLGR